MAATKTIILTGGGTAGHVAPNLALVPYLQADGYEIHYIGGKSGMEQQLAEAAGLQYDGISSGKLRRYFSKKNFTDVFNIFKGVAEAFKLIKKIRPDVIFSKGGFVAVPVVVAGRLRGVPVVIHESDITCGLANKISQPFASAVCCSFPDTVEYLKNKKAVYTGAPIRRELYGGDKDEGLRLCGFDTRKPVLLIVGGSSGSVKINAVVRDALKELTAVYQVAHICGAGNVDGMLSDDGYAQFEFIRDELPHVFAAADIVVSRAGANTVMEMLALNKPALYIPLPLSQSRGDQIKNAESVARRGFARVLDEADLNETTLLTEINNLYADKEKIINAMKDGGFVDGTRNIVNIIKQYTRG